MWKIVWSNLLLSLFLLIRRSSSQSCIKLHKRCMNRWNCQASLIQLLKIDCIDLFPTRSQGQAHCSEECRYSIGNFSTYDSLGKQLFTCPCGLDATCLTFRSRTYKCLHNKMKNGKIGCSEVRRNCKNDTKCSILMEEYLRICTHVISGTECTKECEKIQRQLFSLTVAKDLLSCECDGSLEEEKFCRGVRAHTLHLCTNSPMVTRTSTLDPKTEQKNSVIAEQNNSVTGEQKTNTKRVVGSCDTKHGCSRSIGLKANILLILFTFCRLILFIVAR